jgi:cobalt/nickel transport system permease protein
MHMADALISPSVGGTMLAVSAGLIGYSSLKVKKEMDDRKIPLMGVMGAFIFAAQMINFTIPATGSSGHIGGGLLLSIILGPWAAFLTMASVLMIQALFFADGGLLALGCNIFNLGFFTCFLAYPFIYKKIVGKDITRTRLFIGAIVAAIVGLQLGAFSVVLETLFSGITELPFKTFVLLMQPIHLGIGLVEGLATAAVVLVIHNARPEIIEGNLSGEKTAGPAGPASPPLKKIVIGIALAALITGVTLSWFASTHPDGLEWSMAKTSGKEELESPEKGAHAFFGRLQEKLAFLPDYSFKASKTEEPAGAMEEAEPWPAVNPGTSVSGLAGGVITMLVVLLVGFILKKRKGVA